MVNIFAMCFVFASFCTLPSVFCLRPLDSAIRMRSDVKVA